MIYFLGVDGGQTSTTAVVMEDSGRVLGTGVGGPANHLHEAGGVERVRGSLREAIEVARKAAGIEDAPIRCAYLGMTGGNARMDEICRPAVESLGVERMELGHDSLIALYSVTLGKPGVVVIGGTGSVGFGRDAHGRTARAGGWGYVFGDEGSGYWIAVRALNACARASDGTGRRTSLLSYLLRALQVSTLTDVHRLVYSGALGRPDMAALASAVHEAATARDHVAQTILRQAGEELGRLAAGVIRALKLQEDHLTVGMVGGVFNAGAWVVDPFTRVVCEEAPYARARLPEVPQAVAAALLALEMDGRVVDGSIIDNVRASIANPQA